MSKGWETPKWLWTWRSRTSEAQLTWQGIGTRMRWARHSITTTPWDLKPKAHSRLRFQKNGSLVHSMTELTTMLAQLLSTPRGKVISVLIDIVPELLTEKWRWLTHSLESYLGMTTSQVLATRTPHHTCCTHNTKRVSRTSLCLKLIGHTLTRLMLSRITANRCINWVCSHHLQGRLPLSADQQRSEKRCDATAVVTEFLRIIWLKIYTIDERLSTIFQHEV